MAITKEILNTHPVSTLKKEIAKTNIKGYTKMKKNEVIELMMANKERFSHIKPAEKTERKARADKGKKREGDKQPRKERADKGKVRGKNKKERADKGKKRTKPTEEEDGVSYEFLENDVEDFIELIEDSVEKVKEKVDKTYNKMPPIKDKAEQKKIFNKVLKTRKKVNEFLTDIEKKGKDIRREVKKSEWAKRPKEFMKTGRKVNKFFDFVESKGEEVVKQIKTIDKKNTMSDELKEVIRAVRKKEDEEKVRAEVLRKIRLTKTQRKKEEVQERINEPFYGGTNKNLTRKVGGYDSLANFGWEYKDEPKMKAFYKSFNKEPIKIDLDLEKEEKPLIPRLIPEGSLFKRKLEWTERESTPRGVRDIAKEKVFEFQKVRMGKGRTQIYLARDIKTNDLYADGFSSPEIVGKYFPKKRKGKVVLEGYSFSNLYEKQKPYLQSYYTEKRDRMIDIYNEISEEKKKEKQKEKTI